MSLLRPIALFAVVALAGSSGLIQAQSTGPFNASYLNPIVEAPITWTSISVPHTIELRNFTAEATPVVHLMANDKGQIASAAAVGTRLVLSVDGKTAGPLTVVVRSRTATTIQTADLWVDGKLNKAKIQFSAGATFSMSRLSPGEQVLGIRAAGSPAEHVAYILTADGLQILGRSSGSRTVVSPPVLQDVVVVFASLSGALAGPFRVYRNDASKDTDGDGLADALERSLGTCASKVGSVEGVNCNELADSRDTDGDGLQDGWEVLGKFSTWTDNGGFNSEFLPLPSWGANPRHKDIFVEVDFRRLDLSENQSGLALHMSPAAARQLAGIYADSMTTDFWLKLKHALSVNNPDRLPGINLHLDTGVLPTDPADATIFGDWGGYNPVDAVPDGQGGWIPQKPEQVWTEQMSPGRRGVFHYVMGYSSGGGQCGVGIACGFNMNSPAGAAHEFGHTLGLNHNGPNGLHEPNCKPNYPSLMNYAFLYTYGQFSDGQTLPSLNNHSLKETNAINAGNTSLLNMLQSVFGYKVNPVSGSVDWNRDGFFAPAGSTVRAYANYQPEGSCEYTREGFQDSGLRSERSPAVVYFRNKILIFSIGLDDEVRFNFTTGPWTCSPTIDNCPTPVFNAQTLPLPIGKMLSVDARTYRVNSNLELIIVTGIRSDGSLVEIPLALDSGGWPAWGTVTTISGPGAATGELSLAVSESKTAMAMVYKGPDNTVRYRSRSASGWSAETRLMSGGQPITMPVSASPGLAFTRLPVGVALNETLIGAFADTAGRIQLYSPVSIGQNWARLSIPYQSMYAPVGRPTMGWVGSPGGVVTLGDGSVAVASWTVNRFYILYLEPSANGQNPVRMAMSYVDAAGTYRIGLSAYFDNVWAYGYGMGIVQPSDGALRAVVTSAVPNSRTVIHFRPHADGISDLEYRNYDDWKTLGWGSCKVLASTQAAQWVQCAPAW